MACSSARFSRKRSLYSCSSSDAGADAASLAAGLGGAQVQQLAGVVPVVHGLRGVDALVALQSDQLAAGPAADDLGDLGLADPGFALQQQRPLQRQTPGRSTWPSRRRAGSRASCSAAATSAVGWAQTGHARG